MTTESKVNELIAEVRKDFDEEFVRTRPDIIYSVIIDMLQSMPASKARKPGAIAQQLSAISDISAELERLAKALKERIGVTPGVYGRVSVSRPAKDRSVDNEGLWKFLERNHPAMLGVVFCKASLPAVDTISGAIPKVKSYVTETQGASRVSVKKKGSS